MTQPATEDLTDRQRDVLRLLQAGKSPTEIGRELGISSQAVQGHMKRLRTKGLIEGEPAPQRSASRPTRTRGPAAAPFDPASTISAVVREITAQMETLDAREGEIDAEIDRLREEKRKIGAARKELEKLVPETA